MNLSSWFNTLRSSPKPPDSNRYSDNRRRPHLRRHSDNRSMKNLRRVFVGFQHSRGLRSEV
ncbi:hypothetical protein Hanom_Chr06g00515211 [Helianthus anomalus]